MNVCEGCGTHLGIVFLCGGDVRSRRAISGQSISSLQVFPKVRGTRGERLENYFVDDDGCEYSPSCLQCPLPVCKYDDTVGSKNGGSKIWVFRRS